MFDNYNQKTNTKIVPITPVKKGMFDDYVPPAEPITVKGLAKDIVSSLARPVDNLKNTITAYGGGAVARGIDKATSAITGNPELYSSYTDAVNKLDPSNIAKNTDVSSMLTGVQSKTRDISSLKGVRQTGGDILSTASNFIPVSKGITLAKSVRPLAISGAKTGLAYNLGSTLGSDKETVTPTEVLISGAKGAGTGALFGAGISIAAKTPQAIKNKLSPTNEILNTKLDNSIKNIFKGVTGDAQKINDSAFKAKKGLELLQKEAKNIQVVSDKSPLGQSVMKPLNIQKATPNELLSGVTEMDKKISEIARKSAEEATTKGIRIDTLQAQKIVADAINNGEIPQATGDRLLKQIQNTQNSPLNIHNWVQEVNMKYGKKYQRGNIDDTALGKIADDVANVFRSKLDESVDRKGYAEAFGNNQELKRMLVAVAKKANKKVNFGDISTDAGLDAGIAILTGNPAYMARTVGTGMFKGLLSNIRNQSGLKSLRKAANISSKLPSNTKLPTAGVKAQSTAPKLLELPAPGYIPVNEYKGKGLSGMKVTNTIDDIRTNQYSNTKLPTTAQISTKATETADGKIPATKTSIPKVIKKSPVVIQDSILSKNTKSSSKGSKKLLPKAK